MVAMVIECALFEVHVAAEETFGHREYDIAGFSMSYEINSWFGLRIKKIPTKEAVE
jgi:hypothetical protein